jgi:hypothetical protein
MSIQLRIHSATTDKVSYVQNAPAIIDSIKAQDA